MYQPFPTGAQMPEVQRPPVPPTVANAVKAMYAGAASSVLGIVIDITTVSATKRAIERRSPHLSAAQVDSAQHVLIAAFIIGGVIGAALWVLVAVMCHRGKNWARITGTVLFAISTIDLLAGLAAAPEAGLVKLWSLIVWLIGLAAVIFLWRPESSAFFTGIER